LVGTLKKRREAEAQARRVLALREYARLSRLRFDNGAASYIEVLYAENELFSARLASIQSKAQQYSELVNVFNAMGGGWVTEADRLAPSPVMEGKSPAR
jgi:multidrug efflux system outer membrane protein